VGTDEVRSFVAITLAGDGRTAVEALLKRLQAEATGIAWTKPENLHITLKFLGLVTPERLEALGTSLAAVAAGQTAFALDVRGIGGFPSLARPRAFWVGVESPSLGSLAAAVDAACASHGFLRETRPFRAHVTLGRVRRSAARGRGRPAPLPLDALVEEGDAVFGRSPADALTLFRSDLGPGGARHSPLGSWSFDQERDQ